MQPIDDAMARRTLLDLALLRQRDRSDWEREDQIRRVAVRVLGTLGLLSGIPFVIALMPGMAPTATVVAASFVVAEVVGLLIFTFAL